MEFYQQNKENEENVWEEVDRAEVDVGLLDGLEVEVAKNHPEQSQDRCREGPEITSL